MDHTIIKTAGAGLALLVIGYIIGSLTTGTTIIEKNNTIIKAVECPTCKVCPPEKTCPTIPEIKCPQPNCPENKCPTPEPCPKCLTQDFIDKNLYEIAQMRPPVDNPAWQDAWFTMRNYCLETFGYKNISKFREARSGFDPDLFFRGGTTEKNPGQFTFNYFEQYGRNCFNISQYPDQNDRKRWSWNQESCLSSTITICHL